MIERRKFLLYSNRFIRCSTDIAQIRDRNILLVAGHYAGTPQDIFRNIPIQILDDLSFAEASGPVTLDD